MNVDALNVQIKSQSAVLFGHDDPINDLLTAIKAELATAYQALAQQLGVSKATVKQCIQILKQQGRIHLAGSKKPITRNCYHERHGRKHLEAICLCFWPR